MNNSNSTNNNYGFNNLNENSSNLSNKYSLNVNFDYKQWLPILRKFHNL